MNILPKVKNWNKATGNVNAKNIHWIFEQCEDARVQNEALRICNYCEVGFPIHIIAGSEAREEYQIEILKDKIIISSKGGAGAFYALQTLKQLLKENNGLLDCGVIFDSPDMPHRGFYQDISRGRIPRLETLKSLADKLAECKINSLQLYVEHVFDFPEYDFCKAELGCITEEELRELDDYCYERFIDLVPSLSCFGHLYHLLQSDKYKHLCELSDYEPYNHYWFERMCHHTINPLKEESFGLVSSMIDRYAGIFRSEYFNICCDETFDLGFDVNKDKDKTELYFGFVTRMIQHLQAKGKKVMMWGDVILNHPDYVEKLPRDIVFLNWGYTPNVPEEKFKLLGELNKTQIVCPGTNTWNRFCENVIAEEKNIALLAKYGYDNGAIGILNTNWGDFGNICSIDMATYGIACGACIGWSRDTVFDNDFRENVSGIYYGNKGAVELLAELSPLSHAANWRAIIRFDGLRRVPAESEHFEKARVIMEALTGDREELETYEAAIERCRESENELLMLDNIKEDMLKEMLMAIRGHALMIKWNSAHRSLAVECYVDYDKFRDDYKNMWLKKNKESELKEVLAVFDRAEEVYSSILSH